MNEEVEQIKGKDNMAEAIISVVTEQLGVVIRHELEQEMRLVVGVRKEVKKLTTRLTIIKAVLEDAEKKQIQVKTVKVWLEELKDILYDADDVLDEWNTRILISKLHQRSTNGSHIADRVRSHFFSMFSCFKQVVVRHEIAHRIKDIRERLDEISQDKDHLNLIENQSHEEPRKITSSIVDVAGIHGRDLDKEIIVSRLLGETSHDEIQSQVPVISIVGTGGFGKTTLAQLILQEENVATNFELKLWVCVSEPFGLEKVAIEIVEQATKEKPPMYGWEALHQHLCNSVKGKRFLLVLDDVWTDDFNHWNPLKLSLNGGARGSRIIVTTRNEGVARMIGSTYIHRLGQLSDEDCWQIFQQIAFWGRSQEELERLEDIGLEISKKCKGVPLAAKTLASLMRFKQTKQDWRDVLASDIWDMHQLGKGFLPALFLSYHALPSFLKQCFIYCAVFPKDFKIRKDKLVKLWMAQGFLGSDGELETIGGGYFDDLAMRSFFQDFKKDGEGNIYECKMHDLVHDFAQLVTKTDCYVMEIDGKEISNSKVRHLSVLDTELLFRDVENSYIYNAPKLRTLIRRVSVPVPLALFHQLTCLRALDLSVNELTELPGEVKNLLHLRFLDLSMTKLKELPETMCNLVNLQTLKLKFCKNLRKLPERIGELSNLRHLEVLGATGLCCFPRSIGRLSHLRTLNKFIVDGANGGCIIEDLGNLSYLKGNLEITGLRKVESMNEAKRANLQRKKNLHFLELDFGYFDDATKDDIQRMEGVIEALQPHRELERLVIKGYPGFMFPCWMSSESLLSNIVYLRLYSCNHCTQLPALGKLRSLESIEIEGMELVKQVGIEFLGISEDRDDCTGEIGESGKSAQQQEMVFPRLKKLVLREMEMLEDWEIPLHKDIQIMPRLSELIIYSCRKLKALPILSKLQSLESLSLRCLHAMKHLSAELLGNREARSTSSMVIFPKLTKLEIEIMPEWEEQHFDISVPTESATISGDGDTASNIIMPSLQALEISNCPKLKVVPHYMFSRSLKKLVIRECPKLIGMQHCLPQSLEHLELLRDLGALSKSLRSVTHSHNNGYPNLKYLQIGYSPCSSLPQGLNQLTSLQDLVVSNCMFLDFDPKCLRILPMLSKLDIICCQLLSERSTEDWNIISHVPNITIDYKKITQTN